MKRIFSGLVIIAIVLALGFLVSGMIGKVQKNKETAQIIKRLPDFSFMGIKGGLFHSSEIRSGPVLVVRFHPECEHCRYEISEILKSDLPLSGTKIILVSGAGKDMVRHFMEQFDSAENQGIITLIDTLYKFGEIFGSNTVPSNYLYNKDLELIKAFNGEVKTETILKYFKDGD